MLSIITGRGHLQNLVLWGALVITGASGAGCDKVPLLAPFGSTITLSTSSSVVQANGVAEIQATILEQSGTPVQNGTTVNFSTNLGTLSPREGRTVNGTATVQFVANGQSGTATILATSGNAAATPATGLTLTVGGAAATRVQVTASPSRLTPGGGTSTITATVTDTNGNALSSIPVSFSTTVGTLSSPVATTATSGQATTTLTTSRDATVTATAGATATNTVIVTVSTLPALGISVPSTAVVVQGQTVAFTVTVTQATTDDPFTSLIVNFGDGSSTPPLGTSTTSVQHAYNSSGTFTATVTGTTANGDSKSASTAVVVQPIIVTLAISKAGLTVTFSASVSPSGTTVSSYFWDFGDNNSQVTSVNTAAHTYLAGGTYTARVTVTTANGQNASAPTSFPVP